MLNSLFYSIKQAFVQVFRNRAMSIASVFSITAMLLILGLFFILAVNINVAVESAKQEYDTIQMHLYNETEYAAAEEMISELNAMPEVSEATYLTKDTALEQWKVDWGESGYLLDSLVENPLPNAIVVTVDELTDADTVVAKGKTFDGVEDVIYYKETVDKLVKIADSIQVAALIIMAFLVVVSVVVVSNTIKLTVFARSREITIMKYVGATNWFIRGPFLCEGMLIGLISALVSAGVSALVYSRVLQLIGRDVEVILGIPTVPMGFLTFNLIWIFIALGVSIGACGSIISMRRFLDT